MTAGDRQRIAPWLAVALAMFTVAWGGNEFTPLVVMYRQLAGLDAVTVYWLLGGYFFGIAPALLLGGPLSDRFGRRPLMLPAPLIAILGSLVLAFATGDPILLFAGRIVSGVSIGLAMAVGSSWVKELSVAPHDPRADAGAGSRRAAMALTGGFGIGSIAAASLAQFGPAPMLLPYLVHIAVTAVSVVLVWRTPETFVPSPPTRSLLADLRIPSAWQRRFWFVVVPMAPWVFGLALSAQAVLSGLIMDRVPGFEILVSGIAGLVTLASGFVAQALGRRIDSPRSARGVLVGLLLAVPALLIALVAALFLDVWWTFGAAVALGIAYGVLLVSGLQEVQRIARPDDLGGLTAVYYALTYLGFFVPLVLAALTPWFTYPVMFGAGAVLTLVSLGIVAANSRRNLPGERN